VAEAVAAVGARAGAARRRPVIWRACWLASRLHARLGDGRGRPLADQARKTFEEVKMLSPVKYRLGLDADPEAPAANDLAPPAALSALVDRAARAENRLRRLIRINKRLNSELRLHRVLETVVDTVIELTDAERGFLLLKDAAGELQVKVARNIEESSLDTPELALSRSIAKQAADRGEPVITVDAAGDDRFREAMSVTDLHLRSVLAVPLAVKGNVVGTIYVDHRLRKGVFDDEDVALVLDFAEQGAIAIENARLLAELRRRERQVDGLNRRLERDLQARHEELTEVRQELKETREAAALRYDYKQIVGRTPRMLELFRLLDRVTDTLLPVVVQGESGTGKELVARAIHFNGPRRERPFVSENCAAIPETLLESTLFGYVRGAFTGAERDTRGLFAVADGGTLFLDEVAEMSPAMQGKLLRVLQDGEFRRVGGERPQKVDVRIVVATNKDLGRMVSEGKFRQDLFFRLSVVRLTLPPLRERREDIPSLVDAFLEQFARTSGGTAKKVEPAALATLVGYRWPGNVRELENEIQRAAAFSGARITSADLSPHVTASAEGAVADEGGPDSLTMKPRIERLERTLIREALTQHGGNQTRAAEALGLSRFGLQKKLRRYGIAS
jgi:transcriptional regulator with GAF, ATPase, and Fis domain